MWPRRIRLAKGLIQWRRSIHVGQTRVLSAPADIPDETSAQARWNVDALLEATPSVDTTTEGAELVQTTGEITLTGWSPAGLVQYMLEMVHVTTGLPWWATIAACTVVVRLSLTPIVVRLQANAVKINNLRPQIEPLMNKLQEYRQTGNMAMASTCSTRMMQIYQKNGCNPIKMMFMPLIQMPIFISFFVSLRRMTGLPVDGMTTEGMLWFTNLTVPDPYYVLSFMGCAAFITVIKIGGEIGVTNPQMQKMQNIFIGLGILTIPISSTFPAGLFMYWITSALFSVGQVTVLKIPRVRDALGIPKRIDLPTNPATTSPTTAVVTDPKRSKQKQKGTFDQVKESKQRILYRNYVKTDRARKVERDQGKAYDDILHGKVELYDEPPELHGANDKNERVIYQYSKEQNWPVVKRTVRTKKDQRKWKKWILYGTYNTGWKGAYARKNWSKKF